MTWSPASERRRHPRYEILAQVRVRHLDTDFVLEVKNLSVSGALIELGSLQRPGWVRIGHHVDLTLFVPEEPESTDVGGPIVRIVEDTRQCAFAVQFANPTPEAQRYLARVLGPGRSLRPKPPPLPGT